MKAEPLPTQRESSGAGSSAATSAGTSARSTRQRRAVEAEMAEAEEFRSAQEIHEALRGAGETIGLTTVYRSLQWLVDAGQLDSVKTDAGEAVYRRCSPSHHHHLVCRHCGHTVEIAGPAVEKWAEAMAERHDYSDVSHTVELFGTCTDCAATLATKS